MSEKKSGAPGKNGREDVVRLYTGWVIKRLCLGIYDILAVNGAYALALVLRFYIGDHYLSSAVKYFDAFGAFAPWYTCICLIVFGVFRLYSSRWKYAGVSDLNRLFLANLTTSVVQVAGTLLFVRRMPITYYFIGAAIQFFAITASRFAYRILLIEKARLDRRKRATVNVMIVGTGETSRIMRRHFERSSTSLARPVCIFSCRANDTGGYMDGVPCVYGLDKLAAAIRKYRVECVLLADTAMSGEVRGQIGEICAGCGVEVQDFSGHFLPERGMTLRQLLEHVPGPVDVVNGGAQMSFVSGNDALKAMRGGESIRSVSARDGHVVVEVAAGRVVVNDLDEGWVREVEQETGEKISFF